MSGTRWPAPAKINLFLHILGRRADGYHDLQTMFQFLDVGDEIRLRRRADGVVCRTEELDGVPEDRDLTLLAARSLQARSATSWGADVAVYKSIPVGAGLGGGSSDAATVLVGLNQLWGLGWSTDALADLAIELGADVPVFVRGCSAWAEGKGERLRPVRVEPSWYVLVAPDCHVSTASVFRSPALTRNSLRLKMSDCLDDGSAGSHEICLNSLMRKTRNDCESLVRGQYAVVNDALEWLGQFGMARMTGTGAAVFVPVTTKASGERCVAGAPQGWRTFVARGLNRSPLLERLERTG